VLNNNKIYIFVVQKVCLSCRAGRVVHVIEEQWKCTWEYRRVVEAEPVITVWPSPLMAKHRTS